MARPNSIKIKVVGSDLKRDILSQEGAVHIIRCNLNNLLANLTSTDNILLLYNFYTLV